MSDTFNVPANGTTVTGASFAMWLIEGDQLETAELSITSGENGGTSFFDQTVNFTQSGCSFNQWDYDVCTESTSSFFSQTLNSGTYWLNLQNAVTADGEPVYWDENSGPSSASESEVGTIPSEAFTVLGGTGITSTSSTSTTSTSTTSTSSTGFGSVPEPGSIVLFGSGFLGLLAVLRRKLL